MAVFKATKAVEIERLCSFMGNAHAPQLPLFRAAADGLLAVVHITDATATFPRRLANRTGRPVVVLIGADPDIGKPPPPSEWRCATEAAGWARAAMIHAAGGEPGHYREAARATLAVGRFMLIETNSTDYAAWLGIVRPLVAGAVRLVLPTDGAHPKPMAREAVQ